MMPPCCYGPLYLEKAAQDPAEWWGGTLGRKSSGNQMLWVEKVPGTKCCR